MNVALCQMPVSTEKEANLRMAVQYIEKASRQGADLVVLPEMFNCPYDTRNFRAYGEGRDGISTQRLSEAARASGVWLVAGSIPELDSGHVYNTSFVFNREGELVQYHRKAHLFDINIPGGVQFRESDVLSPGDGATVFETEFGKVGVAVCYDMRFPELFRQMAVKGARLICVPAAFNMTTGPAHWHLTARARALDNQVYMALCSPARDTSADYIAYGHSLVANPWGEIEAELDEREGLLLCELDFERLHEVRQGLPLLQHRRPDIYK